jgi:hypothetical protein
MGFVDERGGAPAAGVDPGEIGVEQRGTRHRPDLSSPDAGPPRVTQTSGVALAVGDQAGAASVHPAYTCTTQAAGQCAYRHYLGATPPVRHMPTPAVGGYCARRPAGCRSRGAGTSRLGTVAGGSADVEVDCSRVGKPLRASYAALPGVVIALPRSRSPRRSRRHSRPGASASRLIASATSAVIPAGLRPSRSAARRTCRPI